MDAARFDYLINGYFDGQLTPPEREELDGLVRSDAAVRKAYWDFALTHTALRAWGEEQAGRAQVQAASHGLESLVETPESLPAAAPAPFPFNLLYLTSDSPGAAALLWLVMAFGAGLVLMVLVMLVVAIRGLDEPGTQPEIAGAAQDGPSKQPPHAAIAGQLRSALDCRWSDGSRVFSPGDALAAGDQVGLNAGLAEIVFRNGAKVLLRGPATLEISSRTSASLQRGELTAVVENAPQGFAVQAPGMKYTDLGTEFGVSVKANGLQEVHVFRGKVKAETSGPWSAASGQNKQLQREDISLATRHAPRATILLGAHEALRIAAPGKPIERIAANEQRFIRAVSEWNCLPLCGTGMGLNSGDSDPHWEIVAVSSEPAFKPQDAVVMAPRNEYVNGARDEAQWLATAAKPVDMPSGCRWTFRTHFDLSGFDPATARIDSRIAVDDYVVEVRLNGNPLVLPKGIAESWNYTSWTPLAIDRGFVEGVNTLEVVIENSGNGGNKKAQNNPVARSNEGPCINPMALCMQWRGTAKRRTPAVD
jgi:hypothetical protein